MPLSLHCWSTNFFKLLAAESEVKSFLPYANLHEYGFLVNQLKVLSRLNDEDQVPISTTFYEQLLQVYIPKAQKDTHDLTEF